MVRSKFMPQKKARIILESLNTNISAAELCRKQNISPPTFYQWKEKFVEGTVHCQNSTVCGR
ncbi:MAG: transposase [Nitrosotalea sp.]